MDGFFITPAAQVSYVLKNGVRDHAKLVSRLIRTQWDIQPSINSRRITGSGNGNAIEIRVCELMAHTFFDQYDLLCIVDHDKDLLNWQPCSYEALNSPMDMVCDDVDQWNWMHNVTVLTGEVNAAAHCGISNVQTSVNAAHFGVSIVQNSVALFTTSQSLLHHAKFLWYVTAWQNHLHHASFLHLKEAVLSVHMTPRSSYMSTFGHCALPKLSLPCRLDQYYFQ